MAAGGLAWPVGAIAFVLALQFTMIFTRALNWDEFFHLTQVVQFTRGTLTQPLQTIFVRLFFWLPMLPGTAIDQIVFARVAMFGCEIVAGAAIAVLATRFTDRTVGAIAALGYLSAGFVLQYGFSFRADPVEAALLMSMLCILCCSSFRGRWPALFGALGALAALYSIKCVLYAPAFAGLAYLRWCEDADRRGFAKRLAAGCGGAALLFAMLLYLHSRGVPHAQESAAALLHSSAQNMPSLGGSPLYRQFILQAALTAPVFALLILAFPLALKSSSLSRAEKVAVVALWSEILVLGAYRNTAQYFYVFILPPVAAACALPLARVVSGRSVKIIVTAFAGFAFVMWAAEDRTTIATQRALVRAAEEIFPEKVAYFDFCGMLPRLDKANIFMTPWGSKNYREGGVPSMAETMRRQAVPLVFEDDPMFTDLLRGRGASSRFLPRDAATLRGTYLPFWGPYWVAGKIIPGNGRPLSAEFLVPGPYTVSEGDVAVDGRTVRSGEVVELARGTHRLKALAKGGSRLTWGRHLRRPEDAPPAGPMWIPF